MEASEREIFGEEYRVVSVESQTLTIRGVRSGKLLKITNPAAPLREVDYPPGRLITLSDPASQPES
jgi:hypothetical protein